MSEDPRRQLIQPIASLVDVLPSAAGQMIKPVVTPLGAWWVSVGDSISGDSARIAPLTETIVSDNAALLTASATLLYVRSSGAFRRGDVLAASDVAATKSGVALASVPPGWSVAHTPAANARATITRAAGGAAVRHLCTSIAATLCGLTAAVETTVQINLRDGATGAGAILWSQTLLVIPGGMTQVALAGLAIAGSANTAMTLEFSAAGGADTFQSVALTGFDVD